MWPLGKEGHNRTPHFAPPSRANPRGRIHQRLSVGCLREAERHLCSDGGARPSEAFPIDARVGRKLGEAPAKRFTVGEAESDLFSFAGFAFDLGSVPALPPSTGP
jgi:hypothetical protein